MNDLGLIRQAEAAVNPRRTRLLAGRRTWLG